MVEVVVSDGKSSRACTAINIDIPQKNFEDFSLHTDFKSEKNDADEIYDISNYDYNKNLGNKVEKKFKLSQLEYLQKKIVELFLKDKFLEENNFGEKPAKNTISQTVTDLWPNAMVAAGVLVVNRYPYLTGNLSETVEFVTLAESKINSNLKAFHSFFFFHNYFF